jgi:hypothetical protein
MGPGRTARREAARILEAGSDSGLTMASPQQAIPFRLAQSSLQLALRFWPEESREWGHALAAELREIERPFEALQWALGGLMLFSRASVSHFLAWLKLPAGSRLSGDSSPLGGGAPILPKRSRLFTAAILLATAVILFLPQSRIAMSTVRATWQGFQFGDGDRRTLEKLAARAEREKDARALAFVALTFPDSDQGAHLSERTVSLDPSFAWIYASRFYCPEDAPRPIEWLSQLHTSDPDNAFVYLAAADAIAQPRYMTMLMHGTPAPGEFESAIAADPQWLAQMESAFRAPRYDNYLGKRWELICYEWDRDPALSPAVVGRGLWSHRIPDLQNVKIFTKIKMRSAQEALASGHPDEAEQIVQQVDSFARRMSQQGEANIERMAALDVSRQANEELRNLYSSTGRPREASDASARLQELESRHRTLGYLPYLSETKTVRLEARLFQISAILLFICGVLMALSFLLLEIRPRSFPQRRAAWQLILCRTADFAPAAFLIISCAFFSSFLPIAHLFARYRSASISVDTFREIRGTLWGLVEVPISVENILDPPLFWWLLTIALMTLAAFRLFRIFAPTRTAPRATS